MKIEETIWHKWVKKAIWLQECKLEASKVVSHVKYGEKSALTIAMLEKLRCHAHF